MPSFAGAKSQGDLPQPRSAYFRVTVPPGTQAGDRHTLPLLAIQTQAEPKSFLSRNLGGLLTGDPAGGW